jgi:fumarate hydratase subunit beta
VGKSRIEIMRKVIFPVTKDIDFNLKEGIEISGKIYCGRDAVLPKIASLFQNGFLEEYGIELRGSVIFHTAVSIAGIGPTSSNKLEIESSIPILSKAGVKLHLGKGVLGEETVGALSHYNSFFAVTPPVSALFGSRIKSKRIVAFSELGMEAFYELEVSNIPAIITIAKGKSV